MWSGRSPCPKTMYSDHKHSHASKHLISKNADPKTLRPLHNHTARVLLLRLCIKHSTARTQPITLGDQIINLLAPLQHTLNSLMQHDLGLIQLLLNLHDAVSLGWILVLDDVIFEFGEGECGIGGGPGGARVGGEKLVDNL